MASVTAFFWKLAGCIMIFTSIASSATLVAIHTEKLNDTSYDMTLLSFDTHTWSSQQFDLGPPSFLWGKSIGSAICNNTYYLFMWADPLQHRILSYDLVTNKFEYYVLEAWYRFKNKYYYNDMTFSCTASPNVLLVGQSYIEINVFETYYYGYELSKIRFRGSTEKSDVFGEFTDNDGFSQASPKFMFDASQNQVWSIFVTHDSNAWPPWDPNSYSKNLAVMNTETGQYEQKYVWPGITPYAAAPYFLFPQTLQGDSFKGAMVTNGTVDFVTMNIQGTNSNVTVQTEIKDADWMKSIDGGMAICGDTAYAIVKNDRTGLLSISSFDIFSGEQTDSFELSRQYQDLRSIACSE